MRDPLVSKKTRNALRDYFARHKTLEEIDAEFEDAQVEWKDLDFPDSSGQRRTRVEQYYASLDFSIWPDVKKFIRVFESVLSQIADYDETAYLANWLERDGFGYDIQKNKFSKPTRLPLIQDVKSFANDFSAQHMLEIIDRIKDSISTDPSLAIGSAKELIECCCKTILLKRGKSAAKHEDLPKLVKETMKELNLLPDNIPDKAKGSETIKRLLSNLATVSNGMAELRGTYGSGHGKDSGFKGLSTRHAKLAVGAATTLVVFLFETEKETCSKLT